jgi:adenosylhomocysteine nucleosidase
MTGDQAKRGFTAIVLISADTEWRIVRAIFPDAQPTSTPYGECLTVELPGPASLSSVTFAQGGWGKIAAAASAEYAIARWRPDLLVNLGTCGGFAGQITHREVILAERTVVYDILEQMGDPDEAIAHFTTDIDLSWLVGPTPNTVRRSTLVSADRDLVGAEIPALASRFGAVAGDWESGAIAWVAARHGTRCLILRGVTDLVSEAGGDAYDGTFDAWAGASEQVMRSLIDQLPAWLERAAYWHWSRTELDQ